MLPDVTHEPLEHRIERAALALRLREPDSLFLSHAWLEACAESWRDHVDFDLIELNRPSQPPVWALISRRREWRHGFLPVRVIALNQSCCPTLDQPWIERNGIFGQRPEEFDRGFAILMNRLAEDSDWDELRLPGLSSEHARQALYEAARIGLVARLELEQPSFHIDLNHIRTKHAGDYLRSLSSNSRQQLRRAKRLTEKTLGPVLIEEANTCEQALAWFNETGPLHRARWGRPDSSEFDSGFDNPEFVRFHQSLIENAFSTQSIQYLKCSAGGQTLAYLYNFVSGDRVHFYLSGVNYALDQAIKPGMLAHWMAIERNLRAGHGSYDFLAGDARYKRSLSTGEDRTLWLVLRRPRLKLEMESRARRLKQKLTGQQADALHRISHPKSTRS